MDEVERLRTENDELRTALREITTRVGNVNERMAMMASKRERQEADMASLSQRVNGLMARLPQWVRVADRLPPPPEDPYECFAAPYVLVTVKGGEVMRARPIYEHDDDAKRTTIYGWRTDGEGWDIEVIAWMPLPEPFKP